MDDGHVAAGTTRPPGRCRSFVSQKAMRSSPNSRTRTQDWRHGALIAALLAVPVTHRPERNAPAGVFPRVRFLSSTGSEVPRVLTELPLANELVDTSAVAEADVDVAAGVDPTAVAGTAAVEA